MKRWFSYFKQRRWYLRLSVVSVMAVAAATIITPAVDAAQQQPNELLRNARRMVQGFQALNQQIEQTIPGERDRLNQLQNLVSRVNGGNEEMYRGTRYTQANVEDLQGILRDVQNKVDRIDRMQACLDALAVGSVEKMIDHDYKLKSAAAMADLENQGRSERLKSVLEFFSKPKNIGCVVAGVAGVILSYYAIKHGARWFERRFCKPKIVKETSRKTVFGKLFGAEEGEARPLDEFIVEPTVKKRLSAIADNMRSAKANGDYLSHLLMYGSSGVGKTMLAKSLALHSELDYACISGSVLAKRSTEEALTEFQRIIAWAKSSSNGTVLILDDAEKILGNESDASESSQRLVSEFLEEVKENQDQGVMFVLLTKEPRKLDPLVLRYIDRSVAIPEPGQPELARLIELYAPKVSQFGFHLAEGLQADFDHFAQQAHEAKLTGRDIEAVFVSNGLSGRVRSTDKPVVTYEILQDVFDEYIRDRKQRDAFVNGA